MKGLESIVKQIQQIAQRFNEITSIKLFGSRARGDNNVTSDIDLAIFGNNIPLSEFSYQLEMEIPTLLQFDLSYMSEINDIIFSEQVEKEGIVIYEKH